MNYKSKVRALFCAAIAITAIETQPSPANAASLGASLTIQALTTTITLASATSSLAVVTFTTNLGGTLGCTRPANNVGSNRLFFDPATPKGKLYMSLLSSAFLSGKKVFVSGDNVCVTASVDPLSAATTAESINWVRIE